MASLFSGGCLCGAVRFEALGEPLFCANCHCLDCQRTRGSAYRPLAAFSESAVGVSGNLTCFKRRTDSGAGAEELFCPACGAHVLAKADVLAGLVQIHAGTLRSGGIQTADGYFYGQCSTLGYYGFGSA